MNTSRLEHIVNSINGIIWEANAETFAFQYISPQVETVLGFTPEEWLTNNTFWQDHIHPDDRERTIDYCHKKSVQGVDHDIEYRMISADGNIVWVRDLVSVIQDNGSPKLLTGLMVDITKRKKLEDKLNQQVEFSDFLLDSLPGLFYMMDEEMNPLRVNNYFCKFFGISRDQLPQVNTLDLFAVREHPNIKETFGKVVNTGFAETETVIVAGGKEYDFYINGSLLELEDRKYVIGYGIDISERIKTQKKNKVLLQEIHHRVKNNLAIISGLLLLELENLQHEPSKHSLKHSLNRIHSMAKVHELLYDTENVASIRVLRYLKEIAEIIDNTLDTENAVEIQFDVDQIEMNVNDAIPLGMLFNELFTSSLENSFDNARRKVLFSISKTNGHYDVRYHDNGAEFAHEIEQNKDNNLGFTIVQTLLQQLNADFTLHTDNQFTLEFSFKPGRTGPHSTLSGS